MTKLTAAVLTVTIAMTTISCGDDDAAADPARFCQIDTELEGLDDLDTATPEQARDLVARTRDLLAEAERVAPDEISTEVRVTADSFREILDFYDDADFDVDPAEFEALVDSNDWFDPPEAAVVFGWIEENCGA